MNVLSKVMQKMLWLLAAVLVLLLLAFWWVRHTSLPQTTGVIKISSPALKNEIKIVRDRYGVPHIRAKSDEDALFALGFVHWQDRAWQMDFQRRIAQGRLSEILGQDALENDKFLRTWGFQKSAKETLPTLSERSKKLISAYTAGINASMAQNKKALEFSILGYSPDPWTDVDSISWSKLMAFDLSNNYEKEILALRIRRALGKNYIDDYLPDYPKDGPTILSSDNVMAAENAPNRTSRETAPLADAELDGLISTLQANIAAARALGLEHLEGKGSNSWVVAGPKALNGKPILANDPHLTLRSPMLWYLADVQGKDLKVIGATIPGLPSVVIGRNEQLAWGVTNLGADAQDLFVVSNRAQLEGRMETIRVKDGPDVLWQVRESEYGPIISDLGKHVRDVAPRVALRWTALDTPDTTLDAFLNLNYAQNWQDFRDSVALFVSPSQNFIYADKEGNIGYQASGKVPIRSAWSGTMPLFNPTKYQWQGYIPFENLPYTYNPPEEVLITANNKVAPDSYQYQLTAPSFWEPPYRAKRLQTLLGSKEKGWTVSDMQSLQMDVNSQLWAELKPYLMNTRTDSDLSAQALFKLRDWNGEQRLDSVESTLFEAWMKQLAKMGQDELGDDEVYLDSNAIAQQIKNNGVLCKNPKIGQTSCASLLKNTLKAATDELADLLGNDMRAWTYNKLHVAPNPHYAFEQVSQLAWLFNHPVATSGGIQTLNVSKNYAGKYTQRVGASYRQIVNLANPNQSVFVGSLGQSGNPLSPHAKDQQQLWLRGDYIPMSTNEADWGRTQTLLLSK